MDRPAWPGPLSLGSFIRTPRWLSRAQLLAFGGTVPGWCGGDIWFLRRVRLAGSSMGHPVSALGS